MVTLKRMARKKVMIDHNEGKQEYESEETTTKVSKRVMMMMRRVLTWAGWGLHQSQHCHCRRFSPKKTPNLKPNILKQ